MADGHDVGHAMSAPSTAGLDVHICCGNTRKAQGKYSHVRCLRASRIQCADVARIQSACTRTHPRSPILTHTHTHTHTHTCTYNHTQTSCCAPLATARASQAHPATRAGASSTPLGTTAAVDPSIAVLPRTHCRIADHVSTSDGCMASTVAQAAFASTRFTITHGYARA